jgi:methylmalonyl-CoA/ethylmalonyl-CoA epimerase
MSSAGSPAIFQQLHHVCIVVPDIDAAVAYYESLGIGPWKDFPPLRNLPQSNLTPDELESLHYKSCDLANIQLQLCQPGPVPTGKRRFLEEKGAGVFHMGFSVPSIDEGERAARDAGLKISDWGRLENGSGFTYFDTADEAGVVLEIRSDWIPAT